jgi:hypothetical protein
MVSLLSSLLNSEGKLGRHREFACFQLLRLDLKPNRQLPTLQDL